MFVELNAEILSIFILFILSVHVDFRVHLRPYLILMLSNLYKLHILSLLQPNLDLTINWFYFFFF